MIFYLVNQGQKLGPYSVEQIKTFLQQGLVTTADQLWTEGWNSWMAIGQVPGFTSNDAEVAEAEEVYIPLRYTSRREDLEKSISERPCESGPCECDQLNDLRKAITPPVQEKSRFPASNSRTV